MEVSSSFVNKTPSRGTAPKSSTISIISLYLVVALIAKYTEENAGNGGDGMESEKSKDADGMTSAMPAESQNK